MSRELWLLRHGKAERYDGTEDFDRMLKKRGKRDTTRIGEWLKERRLIPSLVISSPAARADMSAKILCDTLEIDNQDILIEKRLYDEGLTRIKSLLSEIDPTEERVLLVGHNPELEELLVFLVKDSELPAADKLFPTATLARLSLPNDWSILERHCATLLSITYPKRLAEESQEASD